MLIDGVEASQHVGEVVAPNRAHDRQANRTVHRVAATNPVPETKHVVGVDAELSHTLSVRRYGDEVMLDRILTERVNDPVAMYKADLCTLPSSLYGGPAISVPIGLGDENLPVGLQVMAPVMADDQVYRVAGAVEKALAQQWGGLLLEQAVAL